MISINARSRSTHLLLSGFILAMSVPHLPAIAQTKRPNAQPAAQASAKPPAEPPPQAQPIVSATLADAVRQYRAHPDFGSWGQVWKSVSQLLLQPQAVKTAAASILAANPALTDLAVKVIDAEGGRVWGFPRIPECQSVIIQWQAAVATTVEHTVRRRGRSRVVKQIAYTAVSRAQALTVPNSVTLSDAHLVSSSVAWAGKESKQQTPVISSRFLVLSGEDKGNGSIWLHAYRLSGESWIETADLFSALPPFLTQNIAGKASFSGNDLILNVTGKGGESRPSAINGKPAPSTSGYRIVLKLVGGKYTLEGKSTEDAPALIALQFVQAVQQGRADLAKGWLVDSKLISIPKYLGIMGRPAGQPFKLIPMANPGNGISRFRFMTFEKDDLIIDVGRYKNQLAIKGLFVAPPDPLAQKLVGSLPAADKPADAKSTDAAGK